jgi:methylmalonyl-CoA mutase C-terminal domain/subunit
MVMIAEQKSSRAPFGMQVSKLSTPAFVRHRKQVVRAALQEDVQVVGLSVLSGAHMSLCPRIMELMKKEKLDDVMVLVGGIIPDQDIPKLKAVGVSEIFQPGVSTEEIIDYVRRNIGQRRHPSQP